MSTSHVSTGARTATGACLASFALGVLLHADRLPLWCTGFALAAGAWRAARVRRPALPSPGRLVRVGLVLTVGAAVLFEFRTLNGLAAGTALLTVMGALKLFEMEAPRDRLIVVGVALMLLLAACLDRQDLLRVPLYVALLFVSCTALALAATPGAQLGLAGAVRLVARTLASALPLALLLFVFFPRIAGSFWALPANTTTLTGLGEEMTPGDIDALTDSDEPAFRVRFTDRAPPPALRYWRGPVMHEFDGTTWSRGHAGFHHPLPLQAQGAAYRYHISLEPEKHNWLFALEKPIGPESSGATLSFDDQLLTPQPISQPASYDLTAWPAARTTGELSKSLRQIELRQPPERNRRAQALALELRARSASDAAFIDAVLDYFRQGGFEYTLTPPKLDRDAVDEFLFQTRRGFCGHYASAFVALMRAGHVPARVVTGYLGGEWNPIGGYYLIRQSDAHAWAEVWLDGRGWSRVDPTAVVAPERLTQSLFEFMPQSMSTRERLVRGNAWASQARLAWDATDSWWRDHMQHYDFRRQMALLEELGFTAPDARTLALAVSIALAAWLLWISWQSRAALRGMPPDPLAKSYAQLCGRLARVGLPRRAHEGPLNYSARVAGVRPDLAARVRTLCATYAELRFGNPGGTRDPGRLTEAFRRAVRAFRPGRPMRPTRPARTESSPPTPARPTPPE
jgi:transglutaminase-like putative cysteine protease